ncbi:hypothetical protein Psal006b_02546 [Piscirickettsia salmonis]|uniref:Cro/Cl family transcriptional regulator n=1 Tax=Piscirickettsia salmonis TaxID=1238 RepID=A0A1L6T9K2_PISSA|nr:hypothetical protein [Piscirickettsia salmonis]ALB21851.1 Cro/Cl family transcriptional regulator [Piscirickettsia salmonis]ALT18183.1 hypothetical protein PSLF89_04380 [Piscirickettsia salmonis LF-89 = ATCC VR-1361]ALY02028.1 hypothetical protein AWE47_03370 [Piscirickettsia salmonis]AMA41539.1 hypothetical protein AWJ11_03365 [Piscirickettsia salmonis]AOS34024.1 hypothetical protein AVM72_00605 [Piscirickettsia salmonis]
MISKQDRININKQITSWRKDGSLPSFLEFSKEVREYALQKLNHQQNIEHDEPLKKRIYKKIQNHIYTGFNQPPTFTDLSETMQKWATQQWQEKTKYLIPKVQEQRLAQHRIKMNIKKGRKCSGQVILDTFN